MNKLLPILLVIIFSSTDVLSKEVSNYYCISTEQSPESLNRLVVLRITKNESQDLSAIIENRYNPYEKSINELKNVEEKITSTGYKTINGEILQDGVVIYLKFLEKYSFLRTSTKSSVPTFYSCAKVIQFPKSKFVSLLTPDGAISSWDIGKAKEVAPMTYSIPESWTYTKDKYNYFRYLSNELVSYCFKEPGEYPDDVYEYRDFKRINNMENNKIIVDEFGNINYEIPFEEFRDVLYVRFLPNAPQLETYMLFSVSNTYNFMCWFEVGDSYIFGDKLKNNETQRALLIQNNKLETRNHLRYIDFNQMRQGSKDDNDSEINWVPKAKYNYRQSVFLMDEIYKLKDDE